MSRSISKSTISLFCQGVKISLDNRTHLKEFITEIFKKEGKSLQSLNYIFCTDKALLAINRQYLSHDFYTDIITFDLSVPPGGVQGEIYISIDRVKANAKELGASIK